MLVGRDVEFSKAVELVIEDLQAVRDRYPAYLPVEAADVVVTYLLANRALIQNSLESAYSGLTEGERGLTKEKRRELYYSNGRGELFLQGVDDEWGSMALQIVEGDAESYWIHPGPIEEDNINILVKALDYAKYGTLPDLQVRLFLHPIDQYLP